MRVSMPILECFHKGLIQASYPSVTVAWKVTPLFAEWIASQDNILFQTSTATHDSTALELGCGVSGILALACAPKIHRYIATDQEYVFKLLKQNLENNAMQASKSTVSAKPSTRRKAPVLRPESSTYASNIDILALDWEASDLLSLPSILSLSTDRSCSIDVVLACDCIYNEALVEPFVQACADLCRLPGQSSGSSLKTKPTVCVIAQQLRSHAVFEAWLTAFTRVFSVWRVPDEMLTEGLKVGQGFVVHIGVLKETGLSKCAE